MKIPEYIQSALVDIGFNHAERIEYDGKIFWSLSDVDDNGDPLPVGLPIIYYENDNGLFIQLMQDQVHELLSNL